MRVGACCSLTMLLAAMLVQTTEWFVAPSQAQERVDGDGVLARFLAGNDHSLLSYEAVRKLEVVARGGKMTAFMTARTSLDEDNGFQFHVIEESGSGLLRSRVLHPVLEAERQAKQRQRGRAGALTLANYAFTVDEITPDGLLRVAIKPKRRDELLMDGSILLTADTADLVQMEGLLVKRPSFWTRRVRIVRRYDRIAGARVPVQTSSTADVLVAGQSTFTMRYEYESINGVPVAAQPRLSTSAGR
jgi:hypothetical protein